MRDIKARAQHQRLVPPGLTNAKVSSAIEKAINKRAEKAGADAEYVIKTIMETIERCRQLSRFSIGRACQQVGTDSTRAMF